MRRGEPFVIFAEAASLRDGTARCEDRGLKAHGYYAAIATRRGCSGARVAERELWSNA
jgi:hypothetical protein